MEAGSRAYDAVVVGGGHNGLTAAAYLARAGLSVLVLERLDRVGGAARSAATFPGVDARVSHHASPVSRVPARVVEELDLDVELRAAATTSYAPVLRDGRAGGLLLEGAESPVTRGSFRELTGSDEEHESWRRFNAEVDRLAEAVTPTLLQPLPLEREVREQVPEQVWADVVQTPLGVTLERRFHDDTVRGLAATDALAGTFASLHDPSLVQNRCFLYHRLGDGSGERRVPVGGPAAVAEALARSASDAGAEIVTGAGVSAIRTSADGAEVTWHDGTAEHGVGARFVLADVAPWVLRILRDQVEEAETKPEGAQLVISLLLERLPRLRSGTDPAVAFAGTLHVNQEYSRLEAAYADAAAGRVPGRLPGQAWSASLTDPSVLGDVPSGTQTLTFFGLHTPASLFELDPSARDVAVERALAALDEHLAEPVMDCVARDAEGRPCLEVTTPGDLERDLAMPGGHLFHGPLDWPWAPNRSRLETPAQQWGVHTGHGAVLLCGSGARRGGGVTGVGGHNAAQAVLAMR